MIGFDMVDGDVVVGETIAMTADMELLRQKVQRVLSTNQGEWEYDPDEGIDFYTILRKNPIEDEIKAEIEAALRRIDDTFTITSFSLEMEGRDATIRFEAQNGEGETIQEVLMYAN